MSNLVSPLCFDLVFFVVYPASFTTPSAFSRALGKQPLCRVPGKNTRQTKNTRQHWCLRSATGQALGKPESLPSANSKALGKLLVGLTPSSLWRVFLYSTQQRQIILSVFFLALGKKKIGFCPPNFLCSACIVQDTSCFNMINLSIYLLYLVDLFHLIEFLLINQISTTSDSNKCLKWIKK